MTACKTYYLTRGPIHDVSSQAKAAAASQQVLLLTLSFTAPDGRSIALANKACQSGMPEGQENPGHYIYHIHPYGAHAEAPSASQLGDGRSRKQQQHVGLNCALLSLWQPASRASPEREGGWADMALNTANLFPRSADSSASFPKPCSTIVFLDPVEMAKKIEQTLPGKVLVLLVWRYL